MSLPVLLEETLPHNMIPATEIITAEHALMVVHALEHFGPDARMIVWLGSRNQNHLEQKKIAKILATGPEGLTFMFKNQMWDDERHWHGIHEHIVAEGFPRERLMICHRGFCPGKAPNQHGYRNLPDFEMSMRIKERTGLRMLLDPSHIGGTQENVMEICRQAAEYNFDGYLIEMHSDPDNAKTDAKQQLTPGQLGGILNTLREPTYQKEVA
jgi:chorismate mutase